MEIKGEEGQGEEEMGAKWWKRKAPAQAEVQTREGERHPFGMLNGYVPLSGGELRLYRAIREALPIVDAAVTKLVRLTGGLKVEVPEGQEELEEFLRTVNVGRGQRGVQTFLDSYLDSMLVCGQGVGEMVEFGGLLGYAPIMPVNKFSCEAFVNRGGRIPAPIHSFKN